MDITEKKENTDQLTETKIKSKRLKSASTKSYVENSSEKDKESSLKSSTATNSKEKSRNKKQEWEKYFCYITEKDREKMLQIPPVKKSNKRSKSTSKKRSKSAKPISNTIQTNKNSENFESKNDQDTKKNKDDNNKKERNSEKDNNNKDKKQISFRVDVEKRDITHPFSTPNSRLNDNSSRRNSDSDLDLDLSNVISSLEIKPGYRNLVRSMKANLDQYIRIRDYSYKTMIYTQDFYDYVPKSRIF